MSLRAVRRTRRDFVRLSRAARSFTEPLESRLLLSTYAVTSTADTGPGSLRDGIANSSAQTITSP